LGDHLHQPGGATIAAGLLAHTNLEVVGVVLGFLGVRCGMEATLCGAGAAQVACWPGSSASAGFLMAD
jgi:hypothetical protein